MIGDSPLSDQFRVDAGTTWLNTSHQGPLPQCAIDAVEEAVQLKRDPRRIQDESFLDVPDALRRRLATLLGVSPEDVVLGVGASYGLNILVQGIDWKNGDEILLLENDFPACHAPWEALRSRGVGIRSIPAASDGLTAESVANELRDRTRLLCITWVDSFTGHVRPVADIGSLCRTAGVRFVVNGSQGAGALPIPDLNACADAFTSCGFKWLCGPYGTGFSWIRPEFRETLRSFQNYWLTRERLLELSAAAPTGRVDGVKRNDARRFDCFCPANFFNHMPWIASLEHLCSFSAESIAEHNSALREVFFGTIDDSLFASCSTATPGWNTSSIVAIRPTREGALDRCLAALTAAHISVSVRLGQIRLSPHLFNDRQQLITTAALLNRVGI